MQRVIIAVAVLLLLAGCQPEPEITVYDPNDDIYKFIPPAGDDWIGEFGDSERTRLVHSISELRVVVAQVSARQIALEKFVTGIHDPNAWVEKSE